MQQYLAVIAALAALLAQPARAQDAQAGQVVFRSFCGSCHMVAAGRTLVGPSLFGIVGRKAGSEPSYTKYSPANRDSGKIWTPETLDVYLTSPRDVIPGTTMVFPGLKNPKQREDLIAYLATLK
jgi:cytochrome c2